jgi:hypothetical protein
MNSKRETIPDLFTSRMTKNSKKDRSWDLRMAETACKRLARPWAAVFFLPLISASRFVAKST